MGFQSIQYIWVIIFIVDILLSIITWTTSFFIRFNILKAPQIEQFQQYIPQMIVFIIIWIFISYINKQKYKDIHRFSFFQEFKNIIKNSILALLIMSSLYYFANETLSFSISRKFIIIFWILNTFILIINHVFLFPMFLFIKNKHYPRKSFILGDPTLSKTISEKINNSLISPYKIIKEFSIENKELDINEILKEASQNNVHNFFIVNIKEPLLSSIIKSSINSFINIHYIPYISESLMIETRIENFENTSFIHIVDDPMTLTQRIVKRVFDIFFSFFTLLFISPLLLLISISIKITSKGPIFYKQKRMSLNGKLFNMYKFRSMRLDAEDKTGPVWTQKKDDRVTPLGRFLRKSSLDELPQFYNVLKGDMSVIGPRPERPIFIEQFQKNIPQYMLRHKVKGGISGWAQINGWRGNSSLEERIKADIFYIRNWSLYLDIKIIFLTILKGFFNKNAY